MNTIRISLLAFFVLTLQFISPEIYAQTEHPIDRQITDCKAQDPTTLGIIGCDLKGYEQWTVEMGRVYDLLIQQLDADSQRILKDQQIAWVNMKKLQQEFNNKFYEGKGHAGLMMISSSQTESVRKRALELKTYLDVLNIK